MSLFRNYTMYTAVQVNFKKSYPDFESLIILSLISELLIRKSDSDFLRFDVNLFRNEKEKTLKLK